ncbi:glutathione peroxidase [Poseidonibacter sp.]|uniref:glutathione peroxidase n=1 Tax=Poseidonibacter sp. TaxID=2321188 RepID=UPI00359E1943
MNIYDFNVTDINGQDVCMSKYKDKVLLIVNVASKCGFTNQYEGLEELFRRYKDKEFMVLGFPSNQFARQEPGTLEEIKEFCTNNYNITFDLFSKIDVNGQNELPLYTYLKDEARGIFGTKQIKWNFTKFLVDSKGNIVKRYSSIVPPQDIEEDILKLFYYPTYV